MSKVWRQQTPTLPDEPTHNANGSHFFGYYSMGHVMSKASVRKRWVKVGERAKMQIIEHIPARCRVCEVNAHDKRLMRVCEGRPGKLTKPAFTAAQTDADIRGEARGRQHVQRASRRQSKVRYKERAAPFHPDGTRRVTL